MIQIGQKATTDSILLNVQNTLEEKYNKTKIKNVFLVDRVTNKNILCFDMFERKKMPAEDELHKQCCLGFI